MFSVKDVLTGLQSLKQVWKVSPKFHYHSPCYRLRISVEINISLHISVLLHNASVRRDESGDGFLYYHKFKCRVFQLSHFNSGMEDQKF